MTPSLLLRTSAAVLLAGCVADVGFVTPSRRGRNSLADAPPPTAPPPGPAFDLGPTVEATTLPPPVSGGTLAVRPDGVGVVIADPDRDAVYVVDGDPADRPAVRVVPLAPGDEPGRVAIDRDGRAHVALRGGGALATVDLRAGAIVARREACAAPRGVAYDPASDAVHVACAEGALVTFPAAGGPPSRTVPLPPDARDVVVTGPGTLAVSTFRAAEIVRVAADGRVVTTAPAFDRFERGPRGRLAPAPRVAWRTIAVRGALVVATQSVPGDVADQPAPYYSPEEDDPCSTSPGPVISVGGVGAGVPRAALPVDVAAGPSFLALAAAGNAHTPHESGVILVPTSARSCADHVGIAVAGQITAVGVDGAGRVLAFSREPAALHVIEPIARRAIASVVLSVEAREDTGHAIFHANAGRGMACASCHPEGGEDGHDWPTRAFGPRRTPSLRGTLAGTAPYHWRGEEKDLRALMATTLQDRMGAPALSDPQDAALARYLVNLPPPASRARLADPVAVERGRAAFEVAGCVSCHASARLTTNASADVGTGGAFQIPSLIGVGWRAPLLHDGSAPTVRAVVSRGHGAPAVPLDARAASDLVTYVETL